MRQEFAQQMQEMQMRTTLAEREAATSRELLTTMAAARPTGAHFSDDLRELKSVIDIKLLEKLEVFSGNDAHWESWLAGFEALTGLIGLDEIMTIGSQRTITAAECALNALGGDDVRLKAKALWYLLTSACRGKARNIVKQAEKFNGISDWSFSLKSTARRWLGGSMPC